MSDGVRRLQAECGRDARDAVRAGDRADLPRKCAIVPIAARERSIGLAALARARLRATAITITRCAVHAHMRLPTMPLDPALAPSRHKPGLAGVRGDVRGNA